MPAFDTMSVINTRADAKVYNQHLLHTQVHTLWITSRSRVQRHDVMVLVLVVAIIVTLTMNMLIPSEASPLAQGSWATPPQQPQLQLPHHGPIRARSHSQEST